MGASREPGAALLLGADETVVVERTDHGSDVQGGKVEAMIIFSRGVVLAVSGHQSVISVVVFVMIRATDDIDQRR